MPKRKPNAAEKRHYSRVAEYGCVVCQRPAELHHVLRMAGKVTRRDPRYVVPLCDEHHRGRYGVHGLGSEEAFEIHHGLGAGFLRKWAAEQWDRTSHA